MGHVTRLFLLLGCLTLAALSSSNAQTCIRIMEQDSSLNNLVDPPATETAAFGTFGRVTRIGTGPTPMILIPGLGFSGDIFREFIEPLKNEYTMYAVTLPGFGGTDALPSPDSTVSFGEQSWHNSALSALETLVTTEKLERPVLVGHWMGGTQIALRYALTHPEQTRSVILLAGAACFVATDTSKFPIHPKLDYRIKVTDQYMAPKWFKTVTRETWDDNNFLPGDYAVNPIRGLRLWREAAMPDLHVWVRYLNEFNAQDISLQLDKLTVPTLLLKPGLEGNYFDPGQDYMTGFCHISWAAALPLSKVLKAETIPHSRACLWFDQPDSVLQSVRRFLAAN